jgi:hypothetical protein
MLNIGFVQSPMLKKPNIRLFAQDADLFRQGITIRELLDNPDCERDHLRQGFWIQKASKTAVWLTLRGCDLRQVKPISLSSTLGTGIFR